MKIVKDLKPLVAAARAAGWTVNIRTCGHLRWDAPTGATVFTSSTPSDHRAIHRIRKDLRANGLTV